MAKPKFQVICGDSVKELPQFAERSVKAIITDPPYGIDYQSARRIDKVSWKPKIANDGEPFVAWLPDAYRVTEDGGSLLCFCRWDVQEAFRRAIVTAGYTLKSQVIWDRMAHGMGDLNGQFAPQHDVIWFATKGAFKFAGDRPKSVISEPRVMPEDLLHPNEKPVLLMRKLIRAVTCKGETILDPFGGSFTTGVACALEGRNFIGVELSEYYCRIGEARILRAQGIPCDLPRRIAPKRDLPLFGDTEAR